MDYAQYFDAVFDRESSALVNLKNSMDYQVMGQIVDLLKDARQRQRKVITAGCGTSGAAARRIAHTLSCTETPALFLSPADAPHGGMGVIQKGDVVVLLSKGGNTREIVDYLACCKSKGAYVVGVTANADSLLGRQCDYLLRIDSGEEPCRWGIMPCCSTLTAISVFDAIALTLMRFNHFTLEEFLRIHPNGHTAERLSRIIAQQSVKAI